MKIGRVIQVVSFEIGVGCDLATEHPQCPVNLGMKRYAHLDTSRHLDDDAILLTIRSLYEDFDFRGWINFSHYNEPCLHPARLVGLAKIASMIAPDCPRMVITNGRNFPKDVNCFAVFDAVHVTDYGGALAADKSAIKGLREVTTVKVNHGRLDKRMAGPGPDRRDRGCLYPFNDLAIDHFGNLRLCCFDWQGLASPGNLFRDGLAGCLARWEATVKTLARSPMAPDAPTVCQTCRYKNFQTLGRNHLPSRQAAKIWLRGIA